VRVEFYKTETARRPERGLKEKEKIREILLLPAKGSIPSMTVKSHNDAFHTATIFGIGTF